MNNEAIVDTTNEPLSVGDFSKPATTTNTSNDHATAAPNAFFELIRKYASVSDALRVLGAFSVATAMGLFLLEGVEVANDLYRFLTMLGLTGALTAAGLLMSQLLKEQRGSRVFIGLGLLSIPVNFTVFAAMIYSIMPQDIASLSYPNYALWQVAHARDILLALAAGAAVLLPVIWLGFTVLARSERLWLSATLVLGSVFLMIPLRQELFSAVIAIASAASVWWLVRRNSNDSLALKTPEGRAAIALLFVAPVIIAVRSLFLYEASGILALTLGGLGYFCIRQLMAQRNDSNFYTATLMIMALLCSVFITFATADVVAQHWLTHWDVVIASMILLLLAWDTNHVSSHRRVANTSAFLMVTAAAIALGITALTTSLASVTTAALVILLAVSVYGYLLKKTSVTVIALSSIIVIVALNAQTIWLAAAQTGWWGIGAIGAIAIISGSMLDRAGTIVAMKT